jgi:hypothetical protein
METSNLSRHMTYDILRRRKPAGGDPCNKGCGRKTNHKSGTCIDCRVVNCPKCNVSFTRVRLDSALCATCNGKAKSKRKEYRYAEGI